MLPELSKLRDEFSSRTRHILAERVGYLCSNPHCRRPTIGPHSIADQALRIGRACHIRAAAAGGPRYDPSQTRHERAALSNGIWLCAVCSDFIDKDDVRYSSNALYAWKTAAENEAFRRLFAHTAAVVDSSTPSPAQIVATNKLLDEAYDALAGAMWSSRITWRHISDLAIERAQRAIRDAEVFDASSPRLILLRAACLYARGFADRALDELLRAPTSEAPDNILMRAVCLDTMGQTQESLRLLTRLANDPASPPAVFYNIGRAHFHLGDPEQASIAFRQALAKDPNYLESIEYLARIAYDRRNFDEATRLAAQVYDLMKGDETVALNYALCLTEQKDYDRAITLLKPLLEKASPEIDVLQLSGRIAGELGDSAVAERLLRRVLEEVPSHPVALHNLGMVMLYAGRYEEAEASFLSAKDAGYPEGDDIAGRIQAFREAVASMRTQDGS